MYRTSSSKRSAQPVISSGADLIVESQEKEKNEFILAYKNHTWKSFQTLARSMFVAHGLNLDDLKELEREFFHCLEESKSPLKKKLKADRVVDQPHAKPDALSDDEMNRVRNLKKSDLVVALKAEGIAHKGYMTKAVLLDVYIAGMAQKKQSDVTSKVDEIHDKETTEMEIDSIDTEAKGVVDLTDLDVKADESKPPAEEPRVKPQPMVVQSPGYAMGSNTAGKVAMNQASQGGAVRRIIAEKEQQMARMPAAFPMSSAKKFPLSESKMNHHHHVSALSPITVNLFASKQRPNVSDDDVPTLGVAKLAVHAEQPVALKQSVSVAASKPCAVKDTGSNGLDFERSVMSDVVSKSVSAKPVSTLDHSVNTTAIRRIDPMTTTLQSRIHATPALTGPLTGASSHIPGTSETVKAHLKDRNARAAQLKEETKKNALAMDTRGLHGSANLVAHANAKSMNERLQALQAKRRAELEEKGPTKNIATILSKQAPLSASTGGKMGPQSPPSFKSPAALAHARMDVLTKHNAPQPSRVPSMQKEEAFVNYEMTDTEEYDSDDDSVGSQKDSKPVPKWAHKSNLIKALERQYSSSYKVDPDELFGEVFTCDLELIFNRKTNRYRRRQSSGEWSAHRVTDSERRAYKLAVR